VPNWPYTKEGEAYFSNLISNGCVCVSEHEGKIIGYLAGSVSERITYIDAQLAELENMYILSEYRKFGVGSNLIDCFKRYCIERGVTHLSVTASAKNSSAIAFYIKNGFEDYNITMKCVLK